MKMENIEFICPYCDSILKEQEQEQIINKVKSIIVRWTCEKCNKEIMTNDYIKRIKRRG